MQRKWSGSRYDIAAVVWPMLTRGSNRVVARSRADRVTYRSEAVIAAIQAVGICLIGTVCSCNPVLLTVT